MSSEELLIFRIENDLRSLRMLNELGKKYDYIMVIDNPR